MLDLLPDETYSFTDNGNVAEVTYFQSDVYFLKFCRSPDKVRA